MIKDLWEIIRYGLKQVITSRLTPLVLVFCLMCGLLITRLFQLQVVEVVGRK